MNNMSTTPLEKKEEKLFVISVFLPDKETAEKVIRDIAFDYNTSARLLELERAKQ